MPRWGNSSRLGFGMRHEIRIDFSRARRGKDLASADALHIPMRAWTADIDPATIPDQILKSERARRNALKRGSYTGGVLWKRHNPQTPRCRCKRCMEKRQSG